MKLPVLALALGSLVLLAGCNKDYAVEPAVPLGTDYYPVAVNNYWVFAVTDTTWGRVTALQTSPVSVTTYQLRETLVSTFADAAGQLAYRMVRSRRATPADAWADDSVFTLNASAQTVVAHRGNRRTVELIFPVREGRQWNFNAYNNNTADTITADTRRYRHIGQAYTPGGGGTAYPVALITTNEGTAKAADVFNLRTYMQVFAQGVGPVRRQGRRFVVHYETDASGNILLFPGAYEYGFSHTETLVDHSVQ